MSGGGLTLLGQRDTNFSGLLSMPGDGAAFDIPSSLNLAGSEVTILLQFHELGGHLGTSPFFTQAYDMVAVVFGADPFKYAESNQTGNLLGKKGFSCSVSLSFSSPVTGAVNVTNLSTPILITIPHPPTLDNEILECRYWDPVLLEQRTDGCEIVASFANYSVCACNHLTDFSMGTWNKFKGLKVWPYLSHALRQMHASPHYTVHSCAFLQYIVYIHHTCPKTRISAAEYWGHEDRGAATIYRTPDGKGKRHS